MKIKFLVDYIGRETAMREHKQGEILELDFPQASELIRLGVVAEYTEQAEKPKKKAKEVMNDENA